MKTPQDCTCGCGGQTKGGRFLPGHDARYHAAQKRQSAALDQSMVQAVEAMPRFVCLAPGCDRDFFTERGLQTHVGKAH